jgi:hypothetical protein
MELTRSLISAPTPAIATSYIPSVLRRPISRHHRSHGSRSARHFLKRKHPRVEFQKNPCPLRRSLLILARQKIQPPRWALEHRTKACPNLFGGNPQTQQFGTGPPDHIFSKCVLSHHSLRSKVRLLLPIPTARNHACQCCKLPCTDKTQVAAFSCVAFESSACDLLLVRPSS